MLFVGFGVTWMAGCANNRAKIALDDCECDPCQTMLQQIEYPDLVEEEGTDGSDLLSPPPTTLSDFENLTPWDMTVEECVNMTLANSKVLQKIGGAVVSAPQGATTLYDQALIETNAGASVEAALAAFDARLDSSLTWNHGERIANLPPPFGVVNNSTDNVSFLADLSKTTAAGTRFSYGTRTDFSDGNSPFASVGYDIINQIEVRQPLLRGAGAKVNRIAGPNAIAGNYNGVLIARVRSDISLADFEINVRNLVRDVENNYWELYYAYRDLDTKIEARDSSRETWENRKLRYENGVGRPDDEAQARQQYLNFQNQAQNALVGLLQGQPGVLGSERNLRRLMGLPVNDGRLIRPVSEPTVAPIVFDWTDSQSQAITRRAEIRRQKWTIRQRELELIAAKQLNKWQFDVVGQYGFRGFGERFTGGAGAIASLTGGDLDDWRLGFEFGGPIGNRTGHLAVRNAQLNLVRERTVLREQQRQILHDLGAAFAEVDRSLVAMRTSFNSRIAVQEELEPKRKRVSEGQDQVFFLLDAEQRAATAESAVHRSIVDYNQALLNYAVTSGSLLSRYNISLAEGPWSDAAQQNARTKACRVNTFGPNDCNNDNCPVSLGPYDQSKPGPMATSFVDQPMPQGYPDTSNSIIESYPAQEFDGSSNSYDSETEDTIDGELDGLELNTRQEPATLDFEQDE